jgi:hypothetical protein
MKADEILQRGVVEMRDRGQQRDRDSGERSMVRAVDAFNALTGHSLSERDGWLFMVVLKAARATASDRVREDDYVDGAAYFALAGEAATQYESP